MRAHTQVSSTSCLTWSNLIFWLPFWLFEDLLQVWGGGCGEGFRGNEEGEVWGSYGNDAGDAIKNFVSIFPFTSSSPECRWQDAQSKSRFLAESKIIVTGDASPWPPTQGADRGDGWRVASNASGVFHLLANPALLRTHVYWCCAAQTDEGNQANE